MHTQCGISSEVERGLLNSRAVGSIPTQVAISLKYSSRIKEITMIVKELLALNEAEKVEKTFKIIKSRQRGSDMTSEGTLDELIKYHAYTLETGASYQNEKGNKKIDRAPKSIASLVKNLNNATNNAAANGYSGTSYKLADA